MGSNVDVKITAVQRWSVMGDVVKPGKTTMKRRINSLTSLLRAKSMPVKPASPLVERECAAGDEPCSCSSIDQQQSSKCEERSDITDSCASEESCCSNRKEGKDDKEDAFNIFAEVCSMFDKSGIKVDGLERHRSLEKHKAKFILGEDDLGVIGIVQEEGKVRSARFDWLLITGVFIALTGILSGLFYINGSLQ